MPGAMRGRTTQPLSWLGAVSDCSRHTIAYDHYSLGHVVSILRRQWPSLGLGRGAAPIPPVRSFTVIAAASVGRALLHRLNGRFLFNHRDELAVWQRLAGIKKLSDFNHTLDSFCADARMSLGPGLRNSTPRTKGGVGPARRLKYGAGALD